MWPDRVTIVDYLPHLWAGTLVTLHVTTWSVLLAALAAFAAGTARLSSLRLPHCAAAVYVEVFRGTSLLVQLFWLYFVLPILGLNISAMVAAVLALGLNIGAYGAEVVRGAVLALPRSQYEAAIALNFSTTQRLFRILLPQALPAMIPPFGNLVIELLKGTALVSLITLHDLTFKGQLLRDATYDTALIYGLVLLGYFLIALALTAVMRWLEHRLGRGLLRGGLR